MEAYKYSCAEFLRLSNLLKDEKDPDEQARLTDLIAMYRLAAETFSRPPPAPFSHLTCWTRSENQTEKLSFELDAIRIVEVAEDVSTIRITMFSGTQPNVYEFTGKEYLVFPLRQLLDNIPGLEEHFDGRTRYYLRKDKLKKVTIDHSEKAPTKLVVILNYSDPYIVRLLFDNKVGMLEQLRSTFLMEPTISLQ